jgi:hypothetical protein
MKIIRLAAIICASFAAGWMIHTDSVKAQGSAIRVVAIPTGVSNPGIAQAPGTVVGFSCVPEANGGATCFVATR